MDDILIINNTPLHEGGITPSHHIIRFLKEYFGDRAEIYEEGETVIRPYKYVLIYAGPYGFCSYLDDAAALVDLAENIIGIQNDYTFVLPKTRCDTVESPFRKAFGERQHTLDYWTNCPFFIRTSKSYYVNWNVLTYEPIEPVEPTKDKLVYWGSFRKGRIKSFLRYFNDPSIYPMVIACSSRVHDKYWALNKKIPCRYPVDIPHGLQTYSCTLYIEDETTHDMFHSLANRFYEAVAAGVPMFVDYQCLDTFEQSGVLVKKEWVVKDAADIASKWHLIPQMRKEQIDLWRRDYIEDARRMVRQAENHTDKLADTPRITFPRRRPNV